MRRPCYIIAYLYNSFLQDKFELLSNTMRTIYRLRANELNDNFLEDIQKTYQDKEIEIIVYEVDETEYLFKSERNRRKLLEAKNNVELGINLVKVNVERL